MPVAEHVDVIRALYEPADHRPNADMAEADVVWHVPGNNPVSGEYRGIDQAFGVMADRMKPLDEWRVDVRHVMTHGEMVVATFLLNARRADKIVECEGAHVFRMSPAGKIAEAWEFYVTQEKVDEMFNYRVQ